MRRRTWSVADDVDEHGLPVWPAAERNEQPILDQLVPVTRGRSGVFLEISAATGQHAAHFAPALPAFRYQPSDVDPEHLATLARRVESMEMGNLLPPIRIDVTDDLWPISHAHVIYNANMIHIAPWEATLGLMKGAGRLLPTGGLLVTYGPYRIDGRHTSESNERFDASLRGRDPRWGVRDLSEVARVAEPHGLVPRAPISMPANNLLIVWDRC